MSYKGTRWFKCDFHLHTTASECFQDKAVSPEKWVQRALEQGLNCVAITDHNTGTGIDAIKQAAEGTGLIVFPGVEITCDTAKIHLLILFDVDKSSEDVKYFLAQCDIKDFGERDTFTSKNIFDIVGIAYQRGLIIPAHIDDHNGLSSISHDNLKKFYELDYINAVQIVYQEFLNPNLKIDDTIKPLYKTVKMASEHKKAILTFSDNPHESNSPKHGLRGIGSQYTWIKMEETPSLESLRQALLLPDLRVKNCFDSPNIPYKTSELWIKSLKVTNSEITEDDIPLVIDFSPQLTNIIGGRGSGKSSILRLIRGVFNRTANLSDLSEIRTDHFDFYKKNDSKTTKGIFIGNSIIEVLFSRNDHEYRIIASNITDSKNQEIKIQKFNPSINKWELVNEESFIEFFEFEIYSQKQIYEIAQNPDSLRDRIDKVIAGLDEIKKEREIIKSSFLEKSTKIRTIQQKIFGKGKLQTEIKDLDENIKDYHQSGIAQLLISRETFINQDKTIRKFMEELKSKESLFDDILKEFVVSNLSYDNFEEAYKTELSNYSKEALEEIEKIKSDMLILKGRLEEIRKNYENRISNSDWKNAYCKNFEEFRCQKENLKLKGLDDIENFEKLTTTKAQKEKELAIIIEVERQLSSEKAERTRLQDEYVSKSEGITSKRKEFLNRILKGEKVRINIKPFRNRLNFEQELRHILQRDKEFKNDIDCLVELCFSGNVKEKIKEVREIIFKLRKGEQVNDITGHFKNLISGINDSQLDEIELLLPEDEIEVSYKPEGSFQFRPLSTASPGQKTTAILTFILSHGNMSLILDQPEDDLDNRLVYELVVDRLKKAKENRQVIVVTHNANIPVNGDAEYIISMDSESKKIRVLKTGSVDQSGIKKEICDVMEGSEFAFKMRSKRYKMIDGRSK